MSGFTSMAIQIIVWVNTQVKYRSRLDRGKLGAYIFRKFRNFEKSWDLILFNFSHRPKKVFTKISIRIGRAAIRPIDSVLALVPSDIAAVYPRTELGPQAGRFDTYDKGDTHWNAFGAAVAAEIVLRRLGLDRLTPLNLEYTLKTRHGDLDSKIAGRPAGEMRELSRSNNDAIVAFDSRVHNRGRVVVTDNPQAPGGKLVIFGDSFGAHFRRALLHVFRRLVFVHANSVDADFLRVERPDHVITEMTERFVTLPPSDPSTFRIINLLRTKLEGVSDNEKEELKRVYQGKLDGPESHIAQLFLQAFEPAMPLHMG
jgi:hypothetical protein